MKGRIVEFVGPSMVRAFLTRGSAAAASAFIPGARGLVLLSILFVFYGADASATVGLTASYFGVALVATAGLGVAAVFGFSKHAAVPLESVAQKLESQFRVSAAATVFLIIVTAVAGLIIPSLIAVDPAIFRAYWFGYSVSVIVLPFAATLTGIFQSRNRDTENLLIGITCGVVHVGLTFASASTGQDVLMTVVVAAVGGSLVDLLAVVWRTVFLAPDRSLGIRSIGRGIALFGHRPWAAFRELPGSVAGAMDGLILMTVFAVAGTVATRTSVVDGAIVVFVVATLRTLIIPLKQFGLVGGRLIVQRRALGETDGKRLRTLVAASAAILWPLAALIVALKEVTPVLDVIPWPLVALMSAQLLLEPVTGVAFAAKKIMDRPSFGLRTLAIVSLGGTIPVLLALSLFGVATALTVWGTVFCARVVFFLSLLPRMGLVASGRVRS